MPKWRHTDFKNLDLEVVLGEEDECPIVYLAKLLAKWTQGETKQHEIIWRENKKIVVSLAPFGRSSCGIEHSKHQE